VRYLNGIGVKKDYQEAVRFFGLAADQGFANAQRFLGGVEKNNKESARLYRLAAGQGNKSAQNSLKDKNLENV